MKDKVINLGTMGEKVLVLKHEHKEQSSAHCAACAWETLTPNLIGKMASGNMPPCFEPTKELVRALSLKILVNSPKYRLAVLTGPLPGSR
jgi:hypothetical protein